MVFLHHVRRGVGQQGHGKLHQDITQYVGPVSVEGDERTHVRDPLDR